MSSSIPSPSSPLPSKDLSPPRVVTVKFLEQLVAPLQALGKQLCIARQVDPRYTVVWGTAPIQPLTTFTWNDDFDVFFKKYPFAFEEGKETEPENPTGISKGQTLIIDKEGKMTVPERVAAEPKKEEGGGKENEGKKKTEEDDEDTDDEKPKPKQEAVKAEPPSSDHFLVKNSAREGGVRIGLCGTLHVGVPSLTSSKTPFFIQRYATIIGQVKVYPLHKVLIWIGDKDVKAGTIFTTLNGVCELDLTTAPASLVTGVPVGLDGSFAWLYADLTGKVKIQAFNWKDDKLQPLAPSLLKSPEDAQKEKDEKEKKEKGVKPEEKKASKPNDASDQPSDASSAKKGGDTDDKPSAKPSGDQADNKNAASDKTANEPAAMDEAPVTESANTKSNNGAEDEPEIPEEGKANTLSTSTSTATPGSSFAKSGTTSESKAATPSPKGEAAIEGIVSGTEQMNLKASK